MRPLGNRVLVKRVIQDAKNKGLIILPGQEDKTLKKGIVIKVGQGKYYDKSREWMGLNALLDKVVIFPFYNGTKVQIDDSEDEYLIVNADEILAWEEN